MLLHVHMHNNSNIVQVMLSKITACLHSFHQLNLYPSVTKTCWAKIPQNIKNKIHFFLLHRYDVFFLLFLSPKAF